MSELQLDDVARVDGITRDELHDRFIKTGTPVVIRGLAEQWPAWSKWSPQYFQERFGDRPVMVLDRSLGGSGHAGHYGAPVESTMRKYIDDILVKEGDLRLAARYTVDLARELADDYAFPDLGRSWSRGLLWLFFGAKKSRTPLHFDFGPFHVLHTCFLGKKTFCLFPHDQGWALHRPVLTGRSPVNPHEPDFDKFPRLKQVRGWRVQIDRGDTLYLPAGVWHDVMYHDPSIALTQRFTEDATFVGARVVGAMLKGKLNDVLTALFPKSWARLQERLS